MKGVIAAIFVGCSAVLLTNKVVLLLLRGDTRRNAGRHMLWVPLELLVHLARTLFYILVLIINGSVSEFIDNLLTIHTLVIC